MNMQMDDYDHWFPNDPHIAFSKNVVRTFTIWFMMWHILNLPISDTFRLMMTKISLVCVCNDVQLIRETNFFSLHYLFYRSLLSRIEKEEKSLFFLLVGARQPSSSLILVHCITDERKKEVYFFDGEMMSASSYGLFCLCYNFYFFFSFFSFSARMFVCVCDLVERRNERARSSSLALTDAVQT